MKTRIIILLLLIVVPLMIASAALAQTDRAPAASMYPVQPGSATGGAYHLDGSTWRASGVSTGGKYQLSGPTGPTLTGNGCCCLYLPCLQRNAQ
jgi:hypothetical protein